MTYKEVLDFLMNQLPMFSREGKTAFKPGLDNIVALCHALRDPQHQFPSIHVAGTNGKGSTCHLLAAAFQNNGYKTGLYTSPHLCDFRERFRIDGQLVAQKKVVDFIENNDAIIRQIKPSYFELSVAMAFQIFADEKIDIAIVETGLGGRLDSTNIILPQLSIITQIGYDHVDILGDTLPKIASEKAGIIKPDVPVIIGEKHEETTAVFEHFATKQGAPLHFAEDMWEVTEIADEGSLNVYEVGNKTDNIRSYLKTDLKGVYQKWNIRTALSAVTLMQQKGWNLAWDKVLEAFSKVTTLTGLRGRWEVIQQSPKIILEVAHNPSGMVYLKANLAHEHLNKNGRVNILLGFVKDKDVQQILTYFPKDANYIFTQANVPRALPAKELHGLAERYGLKGVYYAHAEEAIQAALKELGYDDTLLITGSFYVIGEILPLFEKLLKD